MDVDDLAVSILEDMQYYIESEVEAIVFKEYMRDLRRSPSTAMGTYSARMAAVVSIPPAIVDGKWSASIEIPYKAPTRGGEYRSSRRMEYKRNDATGAYRVSASYGRDRLTSMVDKVVETSVLRLATDKGAGYVKIVREKI